MRDEPFGQFLRWLTDSSLDWNQSTLQTTTNIKWLNVAASEWICGMSLLFSRLVIMLPVIKVLSELHSLCWFSQRRSRTPHFWGAHPGGVTTPKFELSRDFCTVHLPPPQVSSSCDHSCGSDRVDKQTHKRTYKQTDATENIHHSLPYYGVG